MKQQIFFTESDKTSIGVGFAKSEIKNHTGISGLKYYLIVMFLRSHMDTFGRITTTLNNLLTECGYSTKSHNQNMYKDFKDIIKSQILDLEYASIDVDINALSPNTIFTISLNPNKIIFFTEDSFCMITIKEFETITSYQHSKINKSILLGVYLFIKQYIYSDSEKNSWSLKISYPSKSQIKKGLGVSSISTIETAISVLISIGMIHVKNGFYIEDHKNTGIYVPARNVYAIDPKELEDEACIKSNLEFIYQKTVYTSDEVSGNTAFLTKEEF